MDTLSYKTISANSKTADKQWVLIDAENEVLGRLASVAALLLRGKHKTNYTPHADCGDNVIIINADKFRLTGNKMHAKTYRVYSGFPGGQKELKIGEIIQKKPEYPVEQAVKRMLPKNKLGAALFRNLKVYAGNSHQQEAQKPKKINLQDIK